MSKNLGYVPVGGSVNFYFNTTSAANAPITLAGTPSLEARKDGDNTEDTSGLTLTVDEDGETGLHHVAIDTSTDATFYADGARISIQIAAGTVDGVSVVAHEIAYFVMGVESVQLTTAAIIALFSSVYGGTVRVNTATGGGAGYITLDAGASASDDAYNDMLLFVVSGTGANQKMSRISDYTGSSKRADLSPSPATNYANGSVFLIVNAEPALTTAQLNTEMDTALNDFFTAARTQLASLPDGDAISLIECMQLAAQAILFKRTETATEQKFFKKDGTTALITKAISDSGGTTTLGAGA